MKDHEKISCKCCEMNQYHYKTHYNEQNVGIILQEKKVIII